MTDMLTVLKDRFHNNMTRHPELSCHIPGPINVPLSRIGQINLDKSAPIFVYCLRGTRSRQAVGELIRMGYRRVKSIGGIIGYKGEREQ